MTKRENILRALRRQRPDYVPFEFHLCESLDQEFRMRTGHDDPMAYYDFDFRFVELDPTMHPVDYTRYHQNLPEGAFIDEWGVGHIRGSFEHFSRTIHPMQSFTSPQQIWDFPMPDMTADYRFSSLERQVKDLHDAGYAAIYGSHALFETSWNLRGLDNFLCDMAIDEPMAEAAFEKITAVMETVNRRAAEAGADIIFCGDDAGTQRGLMMSADMWRRWIKPYTRRAIGAAKRVNPEVLIQYHSDGNIEEIIPDLIDIGVDILNPVQPECMDPIKIKGMYGDQLSFWGTIGTQTTMPFGTPDEVRRKATEMIETVGRDGGLLIAPTHLLEPEVPWENIMAFIDTVTNYRY